MNEHQVDIRPRWAPPAVLPLEQQGWETEMGQYSRETNEGDLRKGQAEKARLNAEEIPKEELEEKEREERKGLSDPN